MDKFNVISYATSIDDLEKDMFQWSTLPYDLKKRSDENCIRMHGMTNLQFYNIQKSKLLANDFSADIDKSDNLVAESVISSLRMSEDFEDKIKISAAAQRSPFIIIIDPFDSKEEVVQKFEKFRMLNQKNQLWSNQTSLNIWGYNVLNMFNMMKQNFAGEDLERFEQDDERNLMSDTILANMESTVDNMIYNNDIVGLYIMKMNQYLVSESYELPRDAKNGYLLLDREIDEALKPDFDTLMPHYVPYFTQSEFNGIDTDNLIEGMDYHEWKSALKEASANNDSDKLLSLGWNPAVPLNEDTLAYARDRQLKWINRYCPKIIDIRNISEKLDIEEVVSESSNTMKQLYSAKNLYPVYIVLSYSDTLFGKVERKLLNVKYSHAGLSVDSNLKEIFTFSFGKEFNGFTTESIDNYIGLSKNAIISVITMFVDEDTRNKIYFTLNDLNDNKKRTRYGFGNILNILRNKAKEYPYPENLSLVCSQFVDTILKIANIDITHKSSNLVIPEDLYKLSDNPKLYKVYEGKAVDYKERKVEKDIKTLFLKNSVRNIKYNEPLDINFTGEAATILESLNELLTPESVITTKGTSSNSLRYQGSTIRKFVDLKRVATYI